jgi:hypothetical protein
LTISPPTTGPKIGTMTMGKLAVAISRPSRLGPAAWTSSIVTMGSMSPAPMPWISRNTIRLPMFQAAPEATDPARNSVSEDSHIRLAPNRAAAQTVTGMAMAMVSR